MAAAKCLVVVVAAAMAVAVAQVSSVAAVPGTASYYTAPYTPSSCYGFEDKGVLIAAASDAIWDNHAACGRRYSVTCTGRTNDGVLQPCKGTSVVVTVVDYCPSPGCQATIDLSYEAFNKIADPNAGKLQIEYTQYVADPNAGKIEIGYTQHVCWVTVKIMITNTTENFMLKD